MIKVAEKSLWRILPGRVISFVLLSLLLGILLGTKIASAQSVNPSSLLVTPSTLVLLVGEDYTLSAVDATGRPVSGAEWALSTPIADLHVENGEAHLNALSAGRATLTASFDGQSASATVSILSGPALPPATVRWSLEPTLGYETLKVLQAHLSVDSPVAFYSIEGSKSSTAIIRALQVLGQQVWMTHLSSSASPLTFKQDLFPYGQTVLNGEPFGNIRQLLIGSNGFVATTGRPGLSAPGLPADGNSILLRGSSDRFGGLLLLERGRFRDSFLDLRAADGTESWRYRSPGRLSKNWTVNQSGDVGIVETLTKPLSAALLVLNGKTGEVRYRIPFPVSSSTINGFKCTNTNILSNLRPSPAGSVFTSEDGNMYLQVETHVESLDMDNCKDKQYVVDNSLALLRVTPTGETEWKTFQHIHSDSAGSFVPQPRVFAGESIPDGFGGVLAAWTYAFPGVVGGQKPYLEARLTRISPSGQRDFTLPMPFWSEGLVGLFDQNMILGEGNALYATNGPILLRFDIQAGELSWARHPPTGEVRLQHSTSGGGLLISNVGRLVYFDANGNGIDLPWTVPTTVLGDIGLAQSDLFNHSPTAPLLLRDAQLCWTGNFVAVEDGPPNGRGALVFFVVQY